MKPKPYRIIGNQYDPNPCVVKISYGDKYVVVKCKTGSGTLKMIENGLNAFLRGGKNNPDGFHFHFYNHIKDNPGCQPKVSYVSQGSESHYQLLVLEQQELDRGLKDSNMLNNQREAYVPPYDDATGLYGWIPPGAVLNYQNWMKRRKRKKTGK